MQGARPGDPPDQLHAAALLLRRPPAASQRDRVSVGSPRVSPGSSSTPFHTGHPQPEVVLGLSRLWWFHTEMSHSYSLLLETVPIPWVRGKGEPQLPRGLGMFTLWGAAAQWQPALSSWVMEGKRRSRSPLQLRVSWEKEKHRGRGSPAAAGRAEAVIWALFIKGLSFPSNQGAATCKRSPTEVGTGRFKALCHPSGQKRVLSKAVPPGIKFISRLMKEIHLRVFHKPRANPCSPELPDGNIIKDHLCNFINGVQSHLTLWPLFPAPGSSDNTQVILGAHRGPASSSVGPCSRITSLFAWVPDLSRALQGVESFQTLRECCQLLYVELWPWRAHLNACPNVTCTRATAAVPVGRDGDSPPRLCRC